MPTPKARARWVRGALVGASSAVMTVGAHAAGGGSIPHGSALVLALGLCAIVGALTATLRLEGRAARWVATTSALGVAQCLGHAALAVTGHHDGGLDVAPSMIAAHAVAAVILGAAIAAAEYLYLMCTSVLCWLRLFARPTPRPAARVRRRATNVPAVRQVLVTGLGMRAPPSAVATV